MDRLAFGNFAGRSGGFKISHQSGVGDLAVWVAGNDSLCRLDLGNFLFYLCGDGLYFCLEWRRKSGSAFGKDPAVEVIF